MQRLAAEVLTDQDDRRDDPEDGVERHRDADADDRQPEGMQTVRAGDRVDRLAQAVLEGPVEDHRHRHDQQGRQIQQRDGAQAPARRHDGLLLGCRLGDPRIGTLMSGPPTRKEVDGEQHAHGDHEQQDRDGRRTGVVAGLDAPVDVDGRRLGLEGDVPGQQDQRAELADRAGEGERAAGDDRRRQVGKQDAPEDPVVGSPERGGGLLHLPIDLHQDRLHRPDHERKRHEEQRHDHSHSGVGGVDPNRGVGPVESQEDEARDDCRQSERQVDDRVEEPLAAEVVTNEHPRDQRPHHRVDRNDDHRGDQGELDGGDSLLVGDRVEEVPEPIAEAPAEDGGQREQHDQADPQDRGAADEHRPAEGGTEAHPRRSGYSGVG